MKCRVCGADFDGRVCPFCRTSVDEIQEYINYRAGRRRFEEKKMPDGRLIAVIAVCLAVIIAVSAVVIKFGKNRGDEPKAEEVIAVSVESTTKKVKTTKVKTTKAKKKKKSSKKDETTTTAKTTTRAAPAITVPEKTRKSDGVTPEFKATMDSYEDFFDEYVIFMKKYEAAGKPVALIADYSNYMKKYVETMEKITKIDLDNLCSADYRYYVDTTSEISLKLAEVE